MVDTATEELLTLAQAAATVPRRRGRKTHVSTLYRWRKPGFRRVQLETIQIGGTCFTSREALQRFFERLTQANRAGDGPLPSRSVCQRQRQSEAAAKELERLGA